ncbi:MAG: hypothetical protein HOF35_09165 [Bacteroidetes bacterium]|jgi:hypothetical protein|nr:hypothetical protein [Bacteroidota bacterium]MBT4290974.1 hypothetical protein [Deltaproteobacteria bacterium]
MSQITIRKIPENIERQIRNLAQKNNCSLNQTIINLLEKALGTKEQGKRKRDLSRLAGTWDTDQVNEFEKNTKIFEQIDEEIWQS